MRVFPVLWLVVLVSLGGVFPAAADLPFKTLPDGTVLHGLSGFVFPPRIGGFELADTHQYDKAGRDVSAGYNTKTIPIAATVFVYPAPPEGEGTLAREYASKRKEVEQGHPEVTVLSEAEITITQGAKKQLGRQAFFSFRGDFGGVDQKLKSRLLVFQQGTNFVEYRFTFPVDPTGEAEKEIEKFIRAWSWR